MINRSFYNPNQSLTRNVPQEALAFVNYIENPFSPQRLISSNRHNILSTHNQSGISNTMRSGNHANPYKDVNSSRDIA